jgi:hypothetical protein
MATIRVYYDYHEDGIAPIWLLIHFGRSGIDWTKQQIYLPIVAPFQRVENEDIHEETISFTILIEDLTVNPYEAELYGIHLGRVLKRLQTREEYQSIYPDEIEQFVIQISDLEEVLQMDIRKIYKHQ